VGGQGSVAADQVRSADGTTIAFTRVGQGRPIIVVGGALSDRGSFTGLVRRLSRHASVIVYDRRGRGASGDRLPHRVADEVDDLLALCEATGPPALVYGHSSGGLLVLGALARGLETGGVVVYEPPYLSARRGRRLERGFVGRLNELLARGERAAAVTAFLVEGTGMSLEAAMGLRSQPSWAGMVDLAHTLAYDVALCAGAEAVDEDVVSEIAVAVQVIVGSRSEGVIRVAAEDLVEDLPEGHLTILEGESHVPSSAALAPVLEGLVGADDSLSCLVSCLPSVRARLGRRTAD
jgi:pimeloyl-ACP methyl ester carboxylesterase